MDFATAIDCTCGRLVVGADGLRREVGKVPADLAHPRGVRDAEAVEALHHGLEGQPARGVEGEGFVEERWGPRTGRPPPEGVRADYPRWPPLRAAV